MKLKNNSSGAPYGIPTTKSTNLPTAQESTGIYAIGFPNLVWVVPIEELGSLCYFRLRQMATANGQWLVTTPISPIHLGATQLLPLRTIATLISPIAPSVTMARHGVVPVSAAFQRLSAVWIIPSFTQNPRATVQLTSFKETSVPWSNVLHQQRCLIGKLYRQSGKTSLDPSCCTICH